ncbi:MAG TPA: hypothetical protein VHK88_20255 [Aquihabitans sp.]|jgi:hypothetical protein|nr:hypothetical protein [Aquihabitans sp.]
MIPTRKVLDAQLVALRDHWPYVGDGEAPPPPVDGRPVSWLTPQPHPGPGPRFGGGETTLTIRVRVSSAASNGSGAAASAARAQAQGLADLHRATMLTGPMIAGTGWRVTGRWHESTAAVPEPSAWTIHDDYRLHVATVAASP